MADPIPNFHVYGEPDRALDIGFVHVETVSTRGVINQGRARPHKHERMGQITFWTSGGGRYFYEEEILHFSAPAMAFVPSLVVHGFEVDPGSDAIVISLANDALASMAAFGRFDVQTPAMAIDTTADPVWPRLHQIMEIALATYRTGGPAAQGVIGALAAAMLTEFESLRRADGSAASGDNSLASALRRQVDLHFRKEWPVERYAALLDVSPWTLAQACKRAFGLPVKELVSNRRLLEAKRLLAFTVRPVQDIAAEIGMEDPAYFSRFFQARMGEPPSRWRRQQSAVLRPEASPD